MGFTVVILFIFFAVIGFTHVMYEIYIKIKDSINKYLEKIQEIDDESMDY